MLWSILVGPSFIERIAIIDNQGIIFDEQILLARDITIPKLNLSHEMRCQIPAQRDCRITNRVRQSTAHLCTKEGEVLTPQNGSFSSGKDRFQDVIRNGPAIVARDDRARYLKYSAQIGEENSAQADE
jgi:hypothetical protein